MNPIDAYFTAKLAFREARREEEHALWNTWKENPNPATLRPIVGAFSGVVGEHLRRYRPPNANEAALRANLTRQVVGAVESYNPTRGAQLSTHVRNRLKRSIRLVNQVGNHAQVSEGRTALFAPIRMAGEELRETLGRDPTPDEIGQRIGQQGRLVREIQIEQGTKDILGSSFESDPTARSAPREREVLDLLRPALRPKEQSLFDHLYGLNGQPRITETGALAKRLGTSSPQISRLKKNILKTYEEYR